MRNTGRAGACSECKAAVAPGCGAVFAGRRLCGECERVFTREDLPAALPESFPPARGFEPHVFKIMQR